MPDLIELRPDGPHSPVYVHQLGTMLAETVRTLAYATRRGQGGLSQPADASDLIGYVKVMAERLPQLLDQVAAFLDDQRGNPALADSYAGNVPGHAPSARVAAGDAIGHLSVAAALAGRLGDQLSAAQNATAGLYIKDSTEEKSRGSD